MYGEAPLDEMFPQHFLIKLRFNGDDHYVFCEAVASFNATKILPSGVSALEEALTTLSDRSTPAVVLPPPGDECAMWSRYLAFMQSGKNKPVPVPPPHPLEEGS